MKTQPRQGRQNSFAHEDNPGSHTNPDPNRIAVVSYGKERPVALASDEAAWAQNRRAASVLIN